MCRPALSLFSRAHNHDTRLAKPPTGKLLSRLKVLKNPTQFLARRIEQEKLPGKIFYSFFVGLTSVEL